jgi:transcriptional regulator with XRE-family HTH domain
MCINRHMTKLATYLAAEGISQRQFAGRLSIDQSVVSRIASGAIKPSLQTAIAIEAATGGAVPVGSWVEPSPSTDAA